MKFVLPGLAAAAFLAFAAPVASAAPAPVGASALAVPGTAAEPAQYRRRYRMMRRRAMRRSMYRGMGRMSAPSQAGNARNPSAPVGQQQQGQTTGGPRY